MSLAWKGHFSWNGAVLVSTGGLLFLLIFMSTDSIKKYLEPIKIIKLFVSRIEMFGCIYTASVHRTSSEKNAKKKPCCRRQKTESEKIFLGKKRCQVDKRFLMGFFCQGKNVYTFIYKVLKQSMSHFSKYMITDLVFGSIISKCSLHVSLNAKIDCLFCWLFGVHGSFLITFAYQKPNEKSFNRIK